MKDLIEAVLAELRASWRFRWVAIGIAWAVAIIAWSVVFLMPDKYEARAQIYVDSTSILKPLLQGLAVTSNTEDESNVVRRVLLARPNLEEVARKTDLVLREKTPEGVEKLLQKLSQDIQIQGDSKLSVYTIIFRDRSPDKAVAVVTNLLNSFVADSVDAGRADTAGAESFLRQQLADYELRLRESEARLAEFKKDNIGMMPDQRGDYFARMQAENSAVEALRGELAVALRQRDEIRRKLAVEGAADAPVPTATQIQAATQIDARIAQSRRELDELVLRFTDRHPEVVALRETIARMEERRKAELGSVIATQGSASPGSGMAVDSVVQSLQIALNNTDVQVASLQAKVAEGQRRVAGLRQFVTTGPEIEAKLAQLTRDYGVTKAQYESLLQRFETARISNDADRSTPFKFKVIDPPRRPVRPVSPARGLLMLVTLVFSLAAGAAAAVGLSLARPVFTSTRALRNATGLPVIGVVSEYLGPSAAQQKRGQRMYAATAGAALLVAFAGLVIIRFPGSRLLRSVLGME